MIMLGARLADEPEDEGVCDIEGIHNESKSSYAMLAKLSGQQNMQEVLEIFAQKLVQNLLNSASADTTDN
jgi:sugar phosphate permease